MNSTQPILRSNLVSRRYGRMGSWSFLLTVMIPIGLATTLDVLPLSGGNTRSLQAEEFRNREPRRERNRQDQRRRGNRERRPRRSADRPHPPRRDDQHPTRRDDRHPPRADRPHTEDHPRPEFREEHFPGPQQSHRELIDVIRELRHEVEQLRQEIRNMRAHRPHPPGRLTPVPPSGTPTYQDDNPANPGHDSPKPAAPNGRTFEPVPPKDYPTHDFQPSTPPKNRRSDNRNDDNRFDTFEAIPTPPKTVDEVPANTIEN